MTAQLIQALGNWIVIEQAKGVLAERAGLDIEAAFSRMRTHAHDHNLELVNIAHGLVNGTLNMEDDSGETA